MSRQSVALTRIGAALGLVACAALPTACRGATAAAPTTAPSTARPTVASSPAPATLLPSAVAFLDAARGVVAGQMVTATRRTAGPSTIQATSDGGRTWRVVCRVGGPVIDVTAFGADHVWALTADTYTRGASSKLLASSDGGATWRQIGRPPMGFVALAFASPQVGWALRNAGSAWSLQKTTDGGRTWHAIARPCPPGTPAAAISFVDSTSGWLLCSGMPGAGQQARELLRTTDGGVIWRKVAGTLSPSEIAMNSSDGLGTFGYPGSLFFLPDGHGWIGLNYAAIVIRTRDGGRTWPQRSARLSDYGAGPVWFLNDSHGFAIAGSGVLFKLLKTQDGGRSWTTVRTWRQPE